MLPVSILTSFEYCKRKLYLQYVLKFREPIRYPLLLGTIKHLVYENVNNSEEEIIKEIIEYTVLEEITAKFEKRYAEIIREIVSAKREGLKLVNLDSNDVFKKNWQFFKRIADLRAKSVFDFIQKYHVFGQDLWKILTPKIQSEIDVVSESIGLKGRIDQIEIYKPDKILPVELKTGSMPKEGVWPGHKLQAGAYAMLLEEKFNISIHEIDIFYIDHAERRKLVMNSFLKQEIVDKIEDVKSLLDSKELPDFCGNDNKCAKCGLKDQCNDYSLLKQKMEEMFTGA